MGSGASSKKYDAGGPAVANPPTPMGKRPSSIMEEYKAVKAEKNAPEGTLIRCPDCGEMYPKTKSASVCAACWREEQLERQEEENMSRQASKVSTSRHPSKADSTGTPGRRSIRQNSKEKNEDEKIVVRSQSLNRRKSTSQLDMQKRTPEMKRHATADGTENLSPGELLLLQEQDRTMGHERQRKSKALTDEEMTQDVIASMEGTGLHLHDHVLVDGKEGAEKGIGVVKGPGARKGLEKLYFEEINKVKGGDGRRKTITA